MKRSFGMFFKLGLFVFVMCVLPTAIYLSQDAYRLQLKLFLYEVKQQQLLSGVRTFLKVYSTISLGKLANYMEVDEPTLRWTFPFLFFPSCFFVCDLNLCLLYLLYMMY